MKTITFLLPGPGNMPSGGYKVVYEYANRLADDGYKVNIIYPMRTSDNKLGVIDHLRFFKRYLQQVKIGFSCRKWFNLDSRVKEHLIYKLNQASVPHSDYYVATAIATAYCLKKFKTDINCKLYLIQGFESWGGVTDEYVYNSYKFGFKNIVISEWLANKVKLSGAKYTLIKNGFDFDYFKLHRRIEDRERYHISMLYHWDKNKGCAYGLKALKIVKKKFTQLTATLFGTPDKPDNLPEWIDYVKTPNKALHNKIYNDAAIYLAPSLQEGWGLTVGEAMICGCAIVCTNTLGFKEMIVDEENGLIAPIKDSMALAERLERLLTDNNLRISLAHKGNVSIQQFKWDESYKKFKILLD